MTAPNSAWAARSSLQAIQYSISISRVSQVARLLRATIWPMVAPTAGSVIFAANLRTTSGSMVVSESTLTTRSPADRRIAATCALRFPTLWGSSRKVNRGSPA